MLLTNIDGARSYATGLRFSRPFFIQKPDKGRYYNLVPWKDSMQPPPNSRLIYLPTCCVLVSQHPYFKFMKDALSGYMCVMSVHVLGEGNLWFVVCKTVSISNVAAKSQVVVSLWTID